MTGMTKPSQKVFAVLRDLVPSNKPHLFDVVDRLEQDSRMDAVWPSLTLSPDTPIEQLELLRTILAAADKATFAPHLESVSKAWHAEKARCVEAVQTLSRFFSRFPTEELSKIKGRDDAAILEEFRQMNKPRPSRCGRQTDPTPLEELHQMKKSLAFAEEFLQGFHPAFEAAVRADLPASRKRGIQETQFCTSLSSLLNERFGKPMHRVVAVTTNVVLGLHNRSDGDEDIEVTTKYVAAAWAREIDARAEDAN
jgi:hypothetical protein